MKLIIDIDKNDYELINKTGITVDWNTAWHGKEKDREMTFALFDFVKALKNGILYEERPQGEWEYNQYDGNANIGNWHCSKCRHIVYGGYSQKPYYNFCPSCGAEMKGGAE